MATMVGLRGADAELWHPGTSHDDHRRNGGLSGGQFHLRQAAAAAAAFDIVPVIAITVVTTARDREGSARG
jgi:hypothetical protein